MAWTKTSLSLPVPFIPTVTCIVCETKLMSLIVNSGLSDALTSIPNLNEKVSECK
jgi:hypothetical protein